MSLDEIDAINILPRRYWPAMLELLLSLKRLPQARYDVLVREIVDRALERRIHEGDVQDFANLLSDGRANEALFEWFLSNPIAHGFDLEKRLNDIVPDPYARRAPN